MTIDITIIFHHFLENYDAAVRLSRQPAFLLQRTYEAGTPSTGREYVDI